MFIDSDNLCDDAKLGIIQQWMDNMPFFIGVKDTNSRFLIGNNFLSKTIGLSNTQDLKGIYDKELNCLAKQMANLFVEEDAKVMNKNCSFTVIFYGLYAKNKPLLMYGKKYPIINEKKVILGCGFCAQDMTTSPLINLVPLLSLRQTMYGNRQLGNQFSYIIAECIPEYDLSRRQVECLFHLLRGQSANDIAMTLNISKRTVETHVDIIKFKLGCDTKSQLIDRAISTGLLNYIPSSLISTVLSHNSRY
jgi:DNA-binding CsgD family transcriptional regulator